MRNLVLALTVLLTVALSMSTLHASSGVSRSNSTKRTGARESHNYRVVKTAADEDEDNDDDDDGDADNDQDDGDGDHQHELGDQHADENNQE